MKRLFVLALSALLAVSLCAVFVSAEETNVAKGKKYTYTGLYTDSNGKSLYTDSAEGKLTDGIAAKDQNDLGYDKSCWVGMNTTAKDISGGACEIVVDLGSSVSGLTKFTVNTQTCGGGVSSPKEVEILLSTDNTNFTSAGKTTKSTKIYDGATSDDATKNYGIYEFTVSTAEKTARYVKYKLSFNTNWCFVSEVGAYTGAPAASETPDQTSSEQKADSSQANSKITSAAESSKAGTSSAAASKAASSAASNAETAESDGLSTGAIIGIVAGVLAVVGIVAAVIAVNKKKNQ